MRILKKESWANYLQLSTELAELRAGIALGAKRRVAFFEGMRFTVSPDLSKCDIEVGLTDRVVIDVIDAKYSLEKALRTDAISLKGRLGTLETYRSCLGIYLNGALRSPGFPVLLSEYRRMVSRSG